MTQPTPAPGERPAPGGDAVDRPGTPAAHASTGAPGHTPAHAPGSASPAGQARLRDSVRRLGRRAVQALALCGAAVLAAAGIAVLLLWAALRPADGDWQERLQWRGVGVAVNMPALLRLATHPLALPLLDGRATDTPLGRWRWRRVSPDQGSAGTGPVQAAPATAAPGVSLSVLAEASAGAAHARSGPDAPRPARSAPQAPAILTGQCAPCRLRLAALGSEPLVIDRARVAVQRAGSQWLRGTLWLGADDAVALRWQAEIGARDATLTLELPPTEAAAVLRAFAASVPEAATARIEGRVALAARGRWGPGHGAHGAWAIEPRVEGLAVSGLGTEAWAGAELPARCRVAGSAPIEGWLPRAVVAAEDQRFWEHPGFDLAQWRAVWQRNQAKGPPKGLPAAATVAATAAAVDDPGIGRANGRVSDPANSRADDPAAPTRPATLHGASTITQQLAKLLVAGDTRSPARKLRELIHAVEMERTLGKGRILQLYLALAPWGEGVCGAAQAAQAHLGRDVNHLGPVASAWLASLLTNPDAQLQALRAGAAPDPARLEHILRGMRPMPGAARRKALEQMVAWRPPLGRSAVAVAAVPAVTAEPGEPGEPAAPAGPDAPAVTAAPPEPAAPVPAPLATGLAARVDPQALAAFLAQAQQPPPGPDAPHAAEPGPTPWPPAEGRPQGDPHAPREP